MKNTIFDIRNNEETRKILDRIEEAKEEIRGRGLTLEDEDFWVFAYKNDVNELYKKTGYDYDKNVQK